MPKNSYNSHIFCVNVIDIVNISTICLFMFLIDFLFKGSPEPLELLGLRVQQCHTGKAVSLNKAVLGIAVSLTLKSNRLCQIFERIRRHIRKGFSPCIMGLDSVVYEKKTRGQKSRDTVLLKI
jgi:hypothetical protein